MQDNTLVSGVAILQVGQVVKWQNKKKNELKKAAIVHLAATKNCGLVQ